MVKRDHVDRIWRQQGGTTKWLRLPRYFCSKCNKYHRGLTENLVKFKHYESPLIEAVVDDIISVEEYRPVEKYPSEGTMKHWKQWFRQNRKNIEGQIRSVGFRLLGFSEELLRSGVSLLDRFRVLQEVDWLSIILRVIYNSGGYLPPYPDAPTFV